MAKYIEAIPPTTKSATMTEIYSPYFLHFSLFFPSKFGFFSTLSVLRLAGLTHIIVDILI